MNNKMPCSATAEELKHNSPEPFFGRDTEYEHDPDAPPRKACVFNDAFGQTIVLSKETNAETGEMSVLLKKPSGETHSFGIDADAASKMIAHLGTYFGYWD